MRSKEAFIDRFKHHLAGLAVYGSAAECQLGPVSKAQRLYNIPADVEKLLALMYEFVTSEPKGQQNGRQEAPAAVTGPPFPRNSGPAAKPAVPERGQG